MKTTRRRFVQHLSLLTAAAAAHGAFAGEQTGHKMSAPAHPSEPLLDASALARYVDPLPIPALAKPSGLRPSPSNPATHIPYYRVAMREFQGKVHRDMRPTTFWGYGASCPGPTFEVRRGEPILVEWANELPPKHFLPIDHTLHGAEADKP